MLQVTFDVECDGLSDGTSVLFLVPAHLQGGGGGRVILGSAAPVLKLLGFGPQPGPHRPYETQVATQWTLSDAAIERIEKARNGGGFTAYFNFEYALISHGAAAPHWPSRSGLSGCHGLASRHRSGSVRTSGRRTSWSNVNSPRQCRSDWAWRSRSGSLPMTTEPSPTDSSKPSGSLRHGPRMT
jgi:hypothetical protein